VALAHGPCTGPCPKKLLLFGRLSGNHLNLPNTLIRFGKFEEITVLMEKRVTLTQTQVISTQWTLKRPKKLLKAKNFFKGQI
jgi:hypothetical protein